MKLMTWRMQVEEETHVVSYQLARMKGKITVTIDGDSFDLPAGFLGLSPQKREIFRLGDEQAILVVDKKGGATLLFRGQPVSPDGATEGQA